MSMFDMHTYTYPGESIAGLHTTGGWGYPQTTMAISYAQQSSEQQRLSKTNKNISPSPKSGSPRPGNFISSIFKIFHRQNSKEPTIEERESNSEDDNNGNQIPEDNGTSKTGVTADENDHSYALSLLFDELHVASSILEEVPRTLEDDCNGNEKDHDIFESEVNTQKCPFLMGSSEGSDDSLTGMEWNSSEDIERPVKNRKIKFADEEGFPIEIVIEYEREELEEEDGEKVVMNLKKLKGLSKLKRKNTDKNASCKKVGANKTSAQSSYQRFYKPYKEDYETNRMQSPGAFSLMGY